MFFSIIIPVYNVEKYLKKCFESVISQNYKNYEVLIICDKCTDNSEKIVDEYVKKHKNFTKVYEENTGLSKARNIGIKKVKGDYILFLDSDDYFESELLYNLNEILLKEQVDLIRFQASEIINDKKINHSEIKFNKMIGKEAFNKIINFHYIENSWLYCYKTEFLLNNNLFFMDNCIAEDYGLTPLVLEKANSVIISDYIGYNYVQRENSLMSDPNYARKIKKAEDMLKQAEFLKERINTDSIITFINNSLIKYVTTLEYKDYKKYNKILKKHGYYNHLKITGITTLKNVLLIKLNAYMFYRYMVK